MSSRIERLSSLHKKVNSENEAFSQKISSYSKVNLLKSRLAPFDKTGELAKEISSYLSKKTFKKQKNNKDNGSELLSKDFIYDLKNMQISLNEISQENDQLNNLNELTDLFVSNLHEKKRAELVVNEETLFKDLNILEQKYNSQNPFDYREKFNPVLVQKALNSHNVPFRQMNVDIEKNNRDKITQLRKHWKEAKTKDKHKIKAWHFVFPIVVLVIAIILLITFYFI